MNARQRPSVGREPLIALLVATAVGPLIALLVVAAIVPLIGCGGTAGAWMWWLGDPKIDVKAEHDLGKGRLVILIDADRGWLKDASIRPLLTSGLVEQFEEHEINTRIVPRDQLARLRQKDTEFERRGAREVGEKLKADLVLHINVRKFTLHDETVNPAYKGKFTVSLKVLDVHATVADDVRLWPRSSEGKTVEVSTELHSGKGSGYDQKLTRRLCEEMAEKIAKLFHDHQESKKL